MHDLFFRRVGLRSVSIVALFCMRVLASGGTADVCRVECPAGDCNVEVLTSRIPPGGLSLHLRRPPTETLPEISVVVLLHTAKPSLRVEPPNALGADFQEHASLLPYSGRNAVEANTILLKRRARGWWIYVDDVLSASFPERMQGPVEISCEAGPARNGGEEEEPYVQRLAPFQFSDDFLVDAEDAKGKELGHWEKLGGAWSVHSVADTVAESVPDRRKRNARRKGRLPEADRSPNFYCLEGSGTNAVFLTGHAFYDRYTMAAAVHAGEGENGIVVLATPENGFHAFTATPGPRDEGLRLTLWRTPTGTLQDRTVLACWDTDLLPGQWHRLAVTVHDERMVAAINGVELPQVATSLPPGGRFGLFAHGPETTRFDDVAAFSHEHVAFPDIHEFRRQLLSLRGSVQAAAGALPLTLREECGEKQPDEHLELIAPADAPALALFGSPGDSPHVLATAVQGGGKPFEVSLIAGWQGENAPAFRFVLRQTATERLMILENAIGGVHPTNELSRSVLPERASATPIQLLLDATHPDGLLRAYADGRLVLLAPEAQAIRGASGLSVPPGSRAAFALPFYRSFRTVYCNKFEKTNAFVIDPFMRHWASPEGEWIETRDKKTWLKGDLFGSVAVHLPWAAPARLHLAVPEDREEGPLQIVAENDRLELRVLESEGTNSVAVAAAALSDLAWRFTDAKGTQSNRWYSIHLENHLLWARSDQRILFTHFLPEPFPGRRMRVEGLTVEHLGQSRVERSNVMDFLFTESLHEWTLNGGRWEVVNRFQCDPRWSHLNGENAVSMAAIWSRYEFQGDFCAEFYAGMRHGWYDRAGDLNLTALGAANSPASGYTFVCTGWDPDESQVTSRLFRNGELLASTDKYLVPRIREGNVRRGYNPLISGGRDMHGAWYYTQLRRADGELQVSFDHEPVLRVRDPDPLHSGGFGIWTYRNSMVVARVKMAAENIRPRRFTATPVQPEKEPSGDVWPSECLPAVAATAKASDLDPAALPPSEHNPPYPALPEGLRIPATTNGIPLAFWTPDTWAAQDPVSNARLSWHPSAEAPDTFQMTARQAGGSFFASNALPAVPLQHLAGWRFEIARSADAQINFHYMVGRKPGAAFEPAQGFFHHLSGTSDTRGPLLLSGATAVPPAASDAPVLDGPWTPVEVWLPAFPKEEDSLWVRVEGFGNLQPSDVQQGLQGNRPGAAYAVRGFAPILMGAPELAPSTLPPEAAASFKSAVNKLVGTTLHSLPLPPSGFPFPTTLHWVLPPDNLNLAANWSSNKHDGVDIRSEITWPVRYLKGLTASVNDQVATVIPRRDNLLQVLIPRDLPNPTSGLYQVSLSTSPRRPVTWGLPTSSRPKEAPPILLALESGEFHLENFETRPAVPEGAANGSLRSTDPVQGHYLLTENKGKPLRLATPLLGETDLARNPVLRFRYRSEGFANVSLRLERLADIAFTETPPYGAGRVRASSPESTNDWRVWTGFPADAIPEQPFRPGAFLNTPKIVLQSCHRVDQTGRYAALAVDEIVAGPAVGTNRPLVVTPRLFDLDQDGFIEWGIVTEPDPASPARAAEDPPEPAWARIAPGTPLAIPVEGLADGLYSVCFRPASPRATGPATRIPVLLDNQPIPLSHTLAPRPDFGNGTELRLQLGLNGGSPPQFQTLQASCDGKAVALSANSVRVALSASAATLRIDWPRLLREPVQRAADGDTLKLRFEGLLDGAGNPSDPHSVAIPIRYAEDKHPPTLLHTSWPTNLFWITSWTEPNYASALQAVGQCRRQMLPATTNTPPILQFHIAGKAATATESFSKTTWSPTSFPYLALRIGFNKLPKKTVPATLRLVLLYKEGDKKPNPVAIDLLLPSNAVPKEVTAKIDWSAGGISELLIDTRRLAMRILKTDALPGTFTGLQLVFTDADGAEFQIHQAVIGAPWRDEDTCTFQAYDASGFAGLTWQGGGSAEGDAIRPAATTLPPDDAEWLRLQLRDRAGNLSSILPLPRMPGPTPPTTVPAP